MHRREMKVIATLGDLDGIFGTRVTIRSWNTMNRIGRILGVDNDR